ncbi:unnamed protein product [Effrenium voratum]|nr:unnamed protein product [Effrenium voratum]
MGAQSTKCHHCACQGSQEDEEANALPGISIAGSERPSPTSSGAPSSPTSPAPDEEEVEWMQLVAPMVGLKATANEFMELSQKIDPGGLELDAFLDAEQEELNREELRVERITKKVKPGNQADRALAERMARKSFRFQVGMGKRAPKQEGNIERPDDEASDASNADKDTAFQTDVRKAIAGDLEADASGASGLDTSDESKRVLRNNLRRTASQLSLMSTMGRDVSERLRIIVENPRDISCFYTLQDGMLGRGSYGTVQRGVVKSTGAQRAVKTISKEQCKEGWGALKNEIFISKRMDHPNVVKLYEIFEDSEKLYLVLELCTGGHLFSLIRSRGSLKESTMIPIMRQILRGVSYLHYCHIAHRDLKPHNILVARTDISRDTGNSIRISDFGLSCEFQPGQMLSALVGTTAYMAPQVLMKCYTQICDLWSCGVILHILLSGFLPFVGPNARKETIRKAILRGKVRLTRWMDVNQTAINLMLKLLKFEEEERLMASEALEHPWLKTSKDKHEVTNLSKEEVVEGLQSFDKLNVFKRAALHLIATMLNDEQTSIPRDTFMMLDANGDGLVSEQELAEVYGPCDLDASVFESEGHRHGHETGISYTQFLAATFDKRQWVQKPVCKAAFNQFDFNGDDHLTLQELVATNSMLGKLHPLDAEKLVRDLDTNNDGMIDFPEFFSMMKAVPCNSSRAVSEASRTSKPSAHETTTSTSAKSG